MERVASLEIGSRQPGHDFSTFTYKNGQLTAKNVSGIAEKPAPLATVSYDSSHSRLTYDANWVNTAFTQAFGSTVMRANNKNGATLTFSTMATELRIYGTKAATYGEIEVIEYCTRIDPPFHVTQDTVPPMTGHPST